ncbi:alkane oxidation protein activator PraA [Pseudomonas sp. F1_0610]|uniref:alkane oxidation protein activator PraA n=1 Tax=Pseudomonas sp. F1_0610 TaxID=3114284 RepID=UPI0039C36B0E
MNSLLKLGLWIFASLAVTLNALAQTTISPAGAPFTAKGDIAFEKGMISANCVISMEGRVSADGKVSYIDKVKFDGGFKCRRVEAKKLPWTLLADSETSGKMTGVEVTVSAPMFGGDCGPNEIVGRWDNNNSKMSAENAEFTGGCKINKVNINISPNMTVTAN